MRIGSKLLLIGAGVAVVFWGWRERQLASASSGEAHRMTCKQLGDSGPGDNAHVVLTDFLMTHQIVYAEAKSGAWKKVWVPAVPIDSEYAKQLQAAEGDATKVAVPRPVKVIVLAKDVKDEMALDDLGGKDELEGMVINVIDELGKEERTLLEKSYGDVSGAQIFEVGRAPTSAVLALLAIAAGALLALAVLASFFRRSPPPVRAPRDGMPPVATVG